ncbi:MAG TPA: S8 family serine peptidase [Gaiellaceae bacterium]|nr:S8 family serine peptidase [Gaiellaceae bacterium]
MARAAVVVSLLALALAPAAVASRAGSPPPSTPGLLTIGAYERTLVQLERGSLAAEGGTLVSGPQRIWVLPTRAAQRVLPDLLARGLVRTVEPDRPIELFRASAEPLIGLEYWRALVGADAATPPGPGKPITVLDTGIDVTHEEFAGRPNTIPLGEQDLTDSSKDFHGTAVSSVAAAPENGLGVVGVYPQAVLRSVDVGDLTVSQVIASLTESMRAGPSVINMSFGVPYTRLLEDTLLTAFRTGSILVAASGNERQEGTPSGPPGNLSHVLTVAATDQRNATAVFSTPSLGVDLAAPGMDIPAAVPRVFEPNGYTLVDGTSFSAPIVTGATAWVWTARPTLDNTQVFDLMRWTANDVAAEGFDRDTGFGVVNIPGALASQAPPRDPQEPNDDIRHVRANGLFRAAAAPITAPNRARTTFRARVDVTEDPEDVYRVFVPAGRIVRITATPDTDVDVDVWRPSATTVFLRGTARARSLLASSGKPGRAVERLSVRNRTRTGFYAFLDVYLPRDGPLDGQYTLTVSTARP